MARLGTEEEAPARRGKRPSRGKSSRLDLTLVSKKMVPEGAWGEGWAERQMRVSCQRPAASGLAFIV